MTTIIPTVGRIMLYGPAPGDDQLTLGRYAASLVCGVADEGRAVNLAVFDATGRYVGGRVGVRVVQEGEAIPESGDHATWMAYQTAVASGAIPPVLHAIPEPAAAPFDALPDALP